VTRELTWTADRTQRELARFVHTPLDLEELNRGIVERVTKHVPLAASCWHTMDPVTVLFTSAWSVHYDPSEFPKLVENEFFVPDAMKLRQLARDRRPVATLWQATNGHIERSPRHGSLFGPQGFGDELRAVFRVGPSVWGAVIASRRKDDPPFSEREIEFFASIGPLLGEAYRRVLIAPEAERNAATEGPGLVIVDAMGAIESATPAGYRWLEDMEVAGTPSPLLSALRAVDAAARAAALGTVLVGLARARVRTRSGEWLLLHASLLDGRHDGRVAVILELARPAEVASILLEGYGLTPREREVVALVLQGQSTQEIATSLGMSAYTVQDHLKSVFLKLGVNSRSELVGMVFRRDYFPGMDSRAQIGGSGYYSEGG
jgi:DNA-binding CsgD family transcriptional regulator